MKKSAPISGLMALLALAAASGASAALFMERGPDPVIYPKQTIPLKFDHRYHVRKPDEEKGITGEGLRCSFCHDRVSESLQSSDRHIPTHEECDSCHDDWIGEEDEPAPVSACARCHGDLDPAGSSRQAAKMTILPPNLVFPHSTHVKADIACTECHKNVPRKAIATRSDLPTMGVCLDCHQKTGAPTQCTTCHLAAGGGRIQTTYPEGTLKPAKHHAYAIHDGHFLRDHSIAAVRDRAYCDNCHTTNDCLACHDGIARNLRYHPADWIAVHPRRARKNDFRCQSCHRLQTFCIDCHIRTGLAPVGDLTITDFRQADSLSRPTRSLRAPGVPVGPHPMDADGWLDPASRNFHGFHAQRNIRSCAACHQEQYCIQCHGSQFGNRSFRRNVNPHGADTERLRNSTAANRNARACLKCHDPNDPRWR